MSVIRRSMIALAALAMSGATGANAAQRTVTFSGMRWVVKQSDARVGPGPNIFSASARNVFVDRRGRLHLRITRSGAAARGPWLSSEVIGARSLGYGTYRWELDTPVDRLNRNAVLGLFTWSNRPGQHNREIDVEFARWGRANAPTNALYTVQPYDQVGNVQHFTTSGVARSFHGFTWAPDHITFFSSTGPAMWVYMGPDVPTIGGESPRMNLWMFRGRRAAGPGRREVIIRRFSFTPYVPGV